MSEGREEEDTLEWLHCPALFLLFHFYTEQAHTHEKEQVIALGQVLVIIVSFVLSRPGPESKHTFENGVLKFCCIESIN